MPLRCTVVVLRLPQERAEIDAPRATAGLPALIDQDLAIAPGPLPRIRHQRY